MNANMKFEIEKTQAVLSMASDKKSGTLLVGTSSRHLFHFQLKNNSLMELLRTHKSIKQTNINCIQLLVSDKENFFVTGQANGVVRILDCKTASFHAEIQAHSRAINGLVCHSSKPIFTTVSDDTFVNVWVGKIDEIKLLMSQRINDQLLVGVQFGENENSLMIAPYDFKYLLHFKNLV